jgi:hypothetical protein
METGGRGCLSVVSVVYCQRSLRQASPSSRGMLPVVVRCVIWHDPENSEIRRTRPALGCCETARKNEG